MIIRRLRKYFNNSCNKRSFLELFLERALRRFSKGVDFLSFKLLYHLYLTIIFLRKDLSK